MDETKVKRRGPKQKLFLEPTAEVISKIELLAGLGLTHEQIWSYHGLNSDFWYKTLKKYPELDAACKRGKAKMLSKVAGKLMQAIEAGKLAAIIFYLKTQGRWSEQHVLTTESPLAIEQKPAIQIQVTDPQEAAKIYQQIMQET